MARARLWAMFSMAVWMAGTVAVALVATQNFRTVDRLLAGSSSAPFQATATLLDPAHAREFLRYLSSELNRLYFLWWNALQAAPLLVVLLLIRRMPAQRRAMWLVVGMLGLAVFVAGVLTPAIVHVGREIDFVPRNPAPPEAVGPLRRFAMLHAASVVLTVVHLVLGTLVTLSIQRDRGRL